MRLLQPSLKTLTACLSRFERSRSSVVFALLAFARVWHSVLCDTNVARKASRRRQKLRLPTHRLISHRTGQNKRATLPFAKCSRSHAHRTAL